MKLNESEIVRRLNETGNKLLQPPNSKNELLILLEETESVLKNVGQGPSQVVQDALIPAMKALIADSLLNNPAPDVRIVVAVCFNEITRITAPDAPYDDDRMKEVFELIVEAFDNLSALSGPSYDKAVSIIVNVANVRSCVLMLDLECEALIIKMFEQFQKNIRSNHPKSVFSAMKTIMTLIIEESESISSELLKILLNSVRKENEKSSSMSCKLGTEVIEESAKTLRPYLRKAISSGLINEDDYGPILKLIYQGGSDGSEYKHVGCSADQAVAAKIPLACPASPILPVQSRELAAKSDLGPQSEKRKRDSSRTEKSSKELKRSKQMMSPRSPHSKAETEHENEKGVRIKTERRPNLQDHDLGNGVASKKPSLSPSGRPNKSCAATSSKSSDLKSPASEGGNVQKESDVLGDSEGKNHQITSLQNKKAGRLKKDSITESGNKSAKNSIKKEMGGMEEPSKKVTRRKRDQGDAEIFETPYGRKKYKEDIVGFRVKVYWPMDKEYYEGRIASYDPIKMLHRVEYDDGDIECLNLKKETFEFTADGDEDDDGQVPIQNDDSPRKEPVSPSPNKVRKKDPATRKQKTPRSSAREDPAAPTTSAAKPNNSKELKPRTPTDAKGEGNKTPHAARENSTLATSAAKPNNSKESKPQTSIDANEVKNTLHAAIEENSTPITSAAKPNNSKDSKPKTATEAKAVSAAKPNNSKDSHSK